jgi:hypothetical protein
MRLVPIALGLLGIVISPYAGNAQAVDDPFSDYLQRSVGITVGGGNAQDANAAIQTINPWPPYVGDRRIRIQGRQGVDAVERMHRLPEPFGREGSNGAAGVNPGQGSGIGISLPPATAVQPISSGN